MSRRNHNDSRDRSRNDGEYIVQFRTDPKGRLLEFHTRDKAQAYRKAREYDERGQLVGFKRHLGIGRWVPLAIGGAS